MSELVGELESCLGGSAPPQRQPPPAADAADTFVEPPPARAPRRRRAGGAGRRALRGVLVALVASLLVAGAAVGTYVLARSLGSDDDATTTATTPPVRLRGVGAHDPFGTGGEHDEDAPAATDGDGATFWRTETYRDNLAKEGVGLVLDAGSPTEVSRLVVQTDTPGFTAEIQAGAAPSGPFTTVGGSRTVAGTTTFPLEDANARYYLVWITDLGTNSVAHVNEIRAQR
jgi:hypothetical protein